MSDVENMALIMSKSRWEKEEEKCVISCRKIQSQIIGYTHALFQQNGSGSKGAIPKFARGYERSVEFGNGDGCASGKVPQGRTRTIGVGVETLQKAHKYPRDAQTVRNISSSLTEILFWMENELIVKGFKNESNSRLLKVKYRFVCSVVWRRCKSSDYQTQQRA